MSRRHAERVAKFMYLPIHDSALGTQSIRQAGHLDESLRERRIRTGELLEIPDRPDDLRSDLITRSGRLEITIPSSGFGIPHIISIVFGLFPPIIVLTMMTPLWVEEEIDPRFKLAGLALMAVILCIPLFFFVYRAINSAKTTTKVVASTERLSIVLNHLFTRRHFAIPSDELEELRISNQIKSAMVFGNKDGILAQSDLRSIVFGHGLQRVELEYLMALILEQVSQ